MPIERIHWDKQDLVACDDRGRATLGSEFANKQVFVYIANTPDPDELVEPREAEKDTLGQMVSWANEELDEDVDWIDLDAERGVVVDKYGEEYETPYRYDPVEDAVVVRDEG